MSEETTTTETTETTPVAEQVADTPAPEVEKTEAAPADKPAEPQEKQEKAEDVKAKHFAYVKKQERALREKEATLKAEAERHQAVLEQAKGELRSIYQRLESDRKELDEARAGVEQLIERVKTDPIGWLKDHGITAEEFYARTQNDGRPTPEFQLKNETERLNKAWEKKYGELAEKLTAQERWRQELEERQTAWEKQRAEAAEKAKQEAEERAAAEQAVRAQGEFLKLLDGDKAKYADLLLYERDSILAAAGELVRSLGPAAEQLTIQDIADELQKSLAEQHAKVRGGQVQQTPKAEEPAAEKPKDPTTKDALDDEVALATKVRQERVQSVPKGQVRQATTLNGNMSGRTSVTTPIEDKEARKRKVIQELENARQ